MALALTLKEGEPLYIIDKQGNQVEVVLYDFQRGCCKAAFTDDQRNFDIVREKARDKRAKGAAA